MISAQGLVDETRRELRALEERICSHPYLDALEQGRVGRDRLRTFAGNQYHIISSDLRSLALLASRYGGSSPSSKYFLDGLRGEVVALEALGTLGEALGMGDTDLRAHEPEPGCFAYSAFVAWLALYGTDAEFAGDFTVNLSAWGANCGRMARALRARQGFSDGQVAFFDLFAGPNTAFEETGLAIIHAGLWRGVEPPLIKRAARLLQAYELLFWDTMYQASMS